MEIYIILIYFSKKIKFFVYFYFLYLKRVFIYLLYIISKKKMDVLQIIQLIYFLNKNHDYYPLYYLLFIFFAWEKRRRRHLVLIMVQFLLQLLLSLLSHQWSLLQQVSNENTSFVSLSFWIVLYSGKPEWNRF